MRLGRPARRLWLGPSLGVLGAAVALAAWHPGERGPLGPAFESQLLDLRFALRGPVPRPDAVVVVAFDDRAMADLAAFPPSRGDIADTVAEVFAGGARAVALDMLLVDTRADDARLIAALGGGAAVLGVAEAPVTAAPPDLRDTGGFAMLAGLDPGDPLPALGPAPGFNGHAALGHVTVRHEPDGELRRVRPARAVRTRDGVLVLPSLAIAAVSAAEGRRPDLILTGAGGQRRLEGAWPPVALDLQAALSLNFYGAAGAIQTVSAAAVKGADLRGRIVFIGATATGFGDRHATPFDATLPGVEVHATLAANLIAGAVLRRDAAAWAGGSALAVVAALAGVASAGRQHPLAAVVAGAATTLAVLSALQAAFHAGWWLDATTVLAALATGLATGWWVRVLDHRRRAANLARFQSPRLVEMLAAQADPIGRATPQAAVVVFVDVADFTARAERLGPDLTAAFLSGFHGRVEAAAEAHGGTIMDFAGDGALVVFGLPEPAADDAPRALRFLETLFAAAEADNFALRAGGHAGAVMLSVLGGPRHRAVSVSGDVVNTASRLQQLAKSRGAALALSDALVHSGPVALDWVRAAGLEPVAGCKLRGRTAPIDVWVGAVPRAGWCDRARKRGGTNGAG